MWFKKQNSTISIKKYPKMLDENQQLLVQFLRYHNSPLSQTGIQKGIFILQGEGLGSHYAFVRWHYGPYCFKIVEDLNYLVGLGFVKETHSFWANRLQYHVNASLTDFPELEESQIAKIRSHEKMFHRQGMQKYLTRLYEVFQIDQYESGTEIPASAKNFIENKK